MFIPEFKLFVTVLLISLQFQHPLRQSNTRLSRTLLSRALIRSEKPKIFFFFPIVSIIKAHSQDRCASSFAAHDNNFSAMSLGSGRDKEWTQDDILWGADTKGWKNHRYSSWSWGNMFRKTLQYVSQCCRQFHVSERDLEPQTLSFVNVQVAEMGPGAALRHLWAVLLAWKIKYQAYHGEKKMKRKKNNGKLKLSQKKEKKISIVECVNKNF